MQELDDPAMAAHSIERTLLKLLSRGGGIFSMNPAEMDPSWSFDAIFLDLCYQVPNCDILT